MQFITIITILATAGFAFAAPPYTSGPAPPPVPATGGDNSMDSVCSQNQKAACCNDASTNVAKSGDNLIGLVTGSLLGGSCSLSVLGGQCSQGAIACCSTSPQSGLINVGSICAPISL